MLGKLKKTLGRRKPLETIPAPTSNATVTPPPPVNEKTVIRERIKSILADPDALEQHYKEMLSSRGTSEFARSQMGQLPEATKRELVRMWLMTTPDENAHGQGENASGANRKRSHSDTSVNVTAEDEARRQKMAKRNTLLQALAIGMPTDPAAPKGPSRPASAESSRLASASSVFETDSEGRGQSHSEPSECRSSQDSNRPEIPAMTIKWIADVKHMRHVVTNRQEYNPKNTAELEFEKMIIQLRLFLRAESISRLLQFIDNDGLANLVGIVTGILDVEWREQHETRYLLGILHCIRIILKTKEGASRFYQLGQHDSLFPPLVRMQFSWGEERRAFFRFDHRAVITEIFYYWVRNVEHDGSSLQERANRLLEYLQDFSDKEKQHHDFMASIYKVRRYKNWHKEVKNTTQPWLGTPWMYYHKENVIPARDQNGREIKRPFSEIFAPTRRPELVSSTVRSHTETLVAHYVAANLDLMNICIVAQPQAEQRNALRREFADCGFEDLFGSKLRLASQVNFPCIDSALKDWVTAAKADRWPVAHVTALPDEQSEPGPPLSSAGDGFGALPSQGLLQFDVLDDTPFDF